MDKFLYICRTRFKVILIGIMVVVFTTQVHAFSCSEWATSSPVRYVVCKNQKTEIRKSTVQISNEEAPRTLVTKGRKNQRRQKSALSVFKKEQAKELVRSSTQLGLGIGLIGGFGYLIGGSGTFQAATFMGPLISGMISDPISKIGNKLCALFTPYLSNPGIRKSIRYRVQYGQRKPLLTSSMQDFLSTLIKKYTHWIEIAGYECKDTEKIIDEVLSFPTVPQSISPALAPICELIKHYPTDVRLRVSEMVVETITESHIEKLEKKSVPLMFVGPPGTGKTHLATRIGHLLGLPVQVIDITKYESINGSSPWSGKPELGVIADILVSGKTGKGNFANKIVVIDEIDKALAQDKNGRFLYDSGPELISLLHTLLETQETEARLHRYGGATYDISHLKIILVGNRTFSEVLGEGYAAALESRVNLVKFHGFSNEQKLSIAREQVMKLCTLYPSISYDKVDKKILEEIVATDTKMGHQGVRVLLKVVDQYMRMLHQGTLIGEIAGVPPVVFDIQQVYSK